MQQIELIVALLAVIGFVGSISRKIPIALPILMALAGMIISFMPAVPPIGLDPDIVFFLFLPPLLSSEAFNTPWKELKNIGDVLSLQAIGLVIVTVIAVAMIMHAAIPLLPWSVAFAFSAIISPTDAVAVSAMGSEVVLPKRLMDIIKGESLINDATGLVAYQIAVAAAVTGQFALSGIAGKFLYLGVGGVLVGLLVGWILAKLRTKLQNRPVEMIVSFMSPFIAYLAAEHLHVSGVITVVTSGLYLGWRGPTMFSAQTRLTHEANWETLTYILNGMCFLLMGLQFKPVIQAVMIYPPQELLLWAAMAALAPIVVRFIWIFAIAPLHSTITKQDAPPNWKHLFVLSWSGMRGVISLAAAMALPLICADGDPFPYRELIIFLTIAVIVSTLLVQGITLPIIVKKLGFGPTQQDFEESERKARLFLAREAMRTIEQYAREKNVDAEDPIVQKMLDRYVELTLVYINPEGEDLTKNEKWRSLQKYVMDSQRQILIGMRDKNQIEIELFRTLQRELDLEETQLNTGRSAV